MKYTYYNDLIDEINKFDFSSLDLKYIVKELKKNNISKKTSEDQTWVDISDGILLTDEIIPNDQETVFPKDNDYQLIKFFRNNPEILLDESLNKIFFHFNSKIKKIKGIEYVHIHSMKNFCIDRHTDGNIVLIKNIRCPQQTDVDEFGFLIDKEIFQPTIHEDIWLDTNYIHSVWNYSNQEWKCLTISIDRNFLIMD